MSRYKVVAGFLLFLLLAAGTAFAEEKVITILHVNDFHGFAEPYKPLGSEELLGGISYLASEAERIRSRQPALFLAAGDMLQGNNWANLFLGESVMELMNAMKFDTMVLGNHEFDFGTGELRKRISEAHFPVLGANVSGFDPVRPYIIREVQGVRIAVVGLVTEDTPVSTHPRNVTGLTFLPVAEVLERCLEDLKDKADIFIVLSHIGFAADRELAQRVGGITAIVGGHSHTKVTEPVVVNGTVIVQAWEHGKALGQLDLYFEDKKVTRVDYRLIEVRPAAGTESPTTAPIVEKYRKKVDGLLDEKVGEALSDLDGERVRSQETDLGDLIADIIRRTARADAAIIGGGSIRTGIKKGEIRIKNIYAVSPFNNYIVAVKLTGRQVRAALEHGVSAIDEGAGRFPQVSGLAFSYVRSAPPGSRVKEVTVNGSPLDPDKEYTVATDDFLAAGGDGYKAFGEAVRESADYSSVGGVMKGEKLVYSNAGRWVRDVIVDYIRSVKRVSPVVEGRIKEVHD